MQKIDLIDQKIQKLIQKKTQLEEKRATTLLKALDQIWGDYLEEDLILGLLVWAKNELHTNPDQEKAWRRLAPRFQKPFPSSDKAS